MNAVFPTPAHLALGDDGTSRIVLNGEPVALDAAAAYARRILALVDDATLADDASIDILTSFAEQLGLTLEEVAVDVGVGVAYGPTMTAGEASRISMAIGQRLAAR